jgi:hypothetical protein
VRLLEDDSVELICAFPTWEQIIRGEEYYHLRSTVCHLFCEKLVGAQTLNHNRNQNRVQYFFIILMPKGRNERVLLVPNSSVCAYQSDMFQDFDKNSNLGASPVYADGLRSSRVG